MATGFTSMMPCTFMSEHDSARKICWEWRRSTLKTPRKIKGIGKTVIRVLGLRKPPGVELGDGKEGMRGQTAAGSLDVRLQLIPEFQRFRDDRLTEDVK